MSHNAFPGFAVCADGSYFTCYRQASAHVEPPGSTPGVFKAKRSTTQGRTWGAEYTIWTPPDGYEVRDSMATTLGDGRVAVTFNRNDYPGYQPTSFVMFSADHGVTFGAPVQLVSGGLLAYPPGTGLAIEGPIVELPNGDLLTSVYSVKPGGSFLTAVIMRSTDDGATWVDLAIIADGDLDAKHYSESCLLRLHTGELIAGVRDDSSSKICITRSSDDGATWSRVRVMFNGSGRPVMQQLTNGAVVIVYREASNDAAMRTSWNGAWSWEPPLYFEDNALFRITYAQMQEVAPNVLGCLYSMEEVNTGGASIRYTNFRAAEAADPLAG